MSHSYRPCYVCKKFAIVTTASSVRIDIKCFVLAMIDVENTNLKNVPPLSTNKIKSTQKCEERKENTQTIAQSHKLHHNCHRTIRYVQRKWIKDFNFLIERRWRVECCDSRNCFGVEKTQMGEENTGILKLAITQINVFFLWHFECNSTIHSVQKQSQNVSFLSERPILSVSEITSHRCYP